MKDKTQSTSVRQRNNTIEADAEEQYSAHRKPSIGQIENILFLTPPQMCSAH